MSLREFNSISHHAVANELMQTLLLLYKHIINKKNLSLFTFKKKGVAFHSWSLIERITF